MLVRAYLPMLVVIVGGATSGCEQRADVIVPPPDEPSPYPELGIAASNYPKVDGSTSAEPLQVILACKVLGARYRWIRADSDSDRARDRARGDDQMSQFRPAHDNRRMIALDVYSKVPLCRYINSVTKHQGTHKAYVKLLSGQADMILVARTLSQDERRLASKLEVELEMVPVALDAFVFLLNNRNPVNSLTLEQIRDIYSGRITNWQQVGGATAEITPYQRNRNSGSQEVMRATVMKNRRMLRASKMLTGQFMGSPILAVSNDLAGIGFSFFYYQEFMAFGGLKVCAIGEVKPTPKTISSREYPLVTEVYQCSRDRNGETWIYQLFRSRRS